MKFGPLTIGRPQNAVEAKPQPDYSELGAPGTSIFGGTMTQQDYNPDLSAPACYDIYDKMRLSDGQVRAGLAVVKLPILRAHWEVESASDSSEDKEIAERLEVGLKRGMSSSFQNYLRQVMLHLDYGSMPFETCWKIDADGMVMVRKLAPRLPRTILRWYADENGGFAGVQQGAIKASGFEFVDIPADKMVVFVNEQEGANMRGTSMLRAAYKHWYYKDGHYRIDAIANERRGVGMDIGTIKAGATNKENIKPALERSLMTSHAHEKMYFIEDEENYTYRVDTGGARGGANAIMATIEHHDLRILRSILAEFLNMGSQSTGSLAMHKDKSSFFLMALEATSDNIADTMTQHLLRPWVDYNWRVKEYPRMKYSRLDTRDTAAMADAVSKLVTAKALTPGGDTEREIRHLFDLPEESDPYEVETAPEMPQNEPEEGENEQIAAIQRRQIERVKALIASGKDVSKIELPYKDELVEAIAGAAG